MAWPHMGWVVFISVYNVLCGKLLTWQFKNYKNNVLVDLVVAMVLD